MLTTIIYLTDSQHTIDKQRHATPLLPQQREIIILLAHITQAFH